MTKLEDIEKAIEQLSPEDMAKFRAWFKELSARSWDEQIEQDMKRLASSIGSPTKPKPSIGIQH